MSMVQGIHKNSPTIGSAGGNFEGACKVSGSKERGWSGEISIIAEFKLRALSDGFRERKKIKEVAQDLQV